MTGMTLGDLLRRQQEGKTAPPRALHEAQIMELRQIAERYGKPCPFKVGDLVTPRANAPVFLAGEPWLVVEVRDDAQPFFGWQESTDCRWGGRYDFRALVVSSSDNSTCVIFWNESVFFEPWAPREAGDPT